MLHMIFLITRRLPVRYLGLRTRVAYAWKAAPGVFAIFSSIKAAHDYLGAMLALMRLEPRQRGRRINEHSPAPLGIT